MRTLDPRKRKALILFQDSDVVTAKQIAELFGFKARSSAQLCHTWVLDGFLEIVDVSRKGRKYKLAMPYVSLITVQKKRL